MGEEREDVRSTLPRTIGRYRLLAELGAGGMAQVKLAVMRARGNFSKLVVLKVPRSEVASDPALLAMFVDEARLAARFNHQNVVQTYEVLEEDGLPIIVMEYLEGQTLAEIIKEGQRNSRPLALDMHLRVVSEALAGLHHAHELRDFDGQPIHLVHRDISPQNIFVTFDGQVKLLDFGIAKASTSQHVTSVGTFKGKVRYMPPEQLTGAAVDRRTDIFAIGAVLWAAATGRRLWTGQTDVMVVSSLLAEAIPSPREARPEVDPRLESIVMRALAPVRDDRYATALEVQNDIEAFLEARQTHPTTKQLGELVSGLFADVRARRTKVIEEQLARAWSVTSDAYRALGASELPAPPSSTRSLPIPVPVPAAIQLIEPAPAPPPAPSLAPLPLTSTAPTAASLAPTEPAAVERPSVYPTTLPNGTVPSRRRSLIGLIVGGLVVGIVPAAIVGFSMRPASSGAAHEARPVAPSSLRAPDPAPPSPPESARPTAESPPPPPPVVDRRPESARSPAPSPSPPRRFVLPAPPPRTRAVASTTPPAGADSPASPAAAAVSVNSSPKRPVRPIDDRLGP